MWFIGLALGCDLEAPIAEADAAVAALDIQALSTASTAVRVALACQPKPLTTAQSARVHRVLGMAAFVAGDPAAADLSFAASRALEPTAPFGSQISGPLADAWERAASSTPPERAPLDVPRRGTLFVDGQPLHTRPAHLPWILQHTDAGETATHLVNAAAPVPAYPGFKPPPELRQRRARPLTILAIGSGVAGAGSLATAAWSRGRYRNPAVDDDAAAGLLAMNRTTGITGYALLGVAAGLGATALVVEW